MWNVGGPPKLRHLIWKACKGSLGVFDVLHKRHIRDTSTCPVYGHGVETIMHSLFDCRMASNIWVHTEFLSHLMEAPPTSFVERFVWMAGKVGKEELATFGSIAWAAWFCRNQVVFI